MKKFTLTFILAALCALMAISCDPSGVSAPAETLSVSLKNPKVSSESGSQFVDVKCSGDWKLNIVSDAESDWASLSVTTGTGNKSNVRLSWKTNSTEAERTIKIVLVSGSKNAICTLTQFAGEYRPDDEPDKEEPSQGGSPDLKNCEWMELPSMDNPSLGYYTHSFDFNGKNYRNYSFGWSQKDRVALWVAYPLCKLYTNGNAGRTEAWEMDPLLGNDSAAPFGGYAGSYDRGHQLPSADRQCCYEANAQTYYGTNMTPQLSALNQKIWAKLEDKVRGYANASDTTYVVTGCMVSPSSKIEKDSYGNNVTVPDAYFKAVLKYSKSSTLGAWNAIGFYFEHRAYSETNVGKQHAMSIDQLEEITGLDFFVNLPAKIGEDKAAKIEATDPTTADLWW